MELVMFVFRNSTNIKAIYAGKLNDIVFLTGLRLFQRSSYRRKIMIITFTTQNIDGMRKEWCFYSIEAILKDWWTNDAEKLPSGDDPVLEVYIDNEMVSGIEDVDHLIRHLNILYWTRQELPESDIVNTINKLEEVFVEVENFSCAFS